jgi:hypothetical protein
MICVWGGDGDEGRREEGRDKNEMKVNARN